MPSAIPTPTQTKATWDDFVSLPDDDRRELIDGVLMEVEVPNEIHEHVVAQVVGPLWSWCRTNGGHVLTSGYKVRIADERGVMPDVQYFRKGRGSTGSKGLEQGAPDLAVEVISPTSRRYDRVTKLNWYIEIGTPEYWIIDPESRTLERFVLRDGQYAVTDALAETGKFRPASFDGLEIDLAELFVIPA